MKPVGFFIAFVIAFAISSWVWVWYSYLWSPSTITFLQGFFIAALSTPFFWILQQAKEFKTVTDAVMSLLFIVSILYQVFIWVGVAQPHFFN